MDSEKKAPASSVNRKNSQVEKDFSLYSTESDDGWNFLNFIALLKQRKRYIYRIAIPFFLLVLLYTLIVPPVYESSARLIVQPENVEESRLAIGQVPILQRMFGYSEVGSQIEFLRSRTLVTKLVESGYLQVQIEDLDNPVSITGRILTFPRKVLTLLKSFFLPSKKEYERSDLLNKVRVSYAQVASIPYSETIKYQMQIVGEDRFRITGDSLETELEGKFGSMIDLGRAKIIFQKSPAAEIGDRFKIKIFNKDRETDLVAKNLRVHRAALDANHILVSLRHRNPTLAESLLGKLLEIYQSLNRELKARDTQQALNFIRDETRDVEAKLEASQRKVDEFQERFGVFDLGAEAQAIMEQLTSMEASRNSSEIYSKTIKFVLSGLEKGKPEYSARFLALPQTVEVEGTGILGKLAQLIQSREAQLLYKKPTHPDIVQLNEQIDTLSKQAITVLKSDYQRTGKKLSELDAKISELKDELLRLPRLESELAQLTLEVSANQETFAYLKKREAEANIVLNSIVSDAEILDPPSEPWMPVKPNYPLYLAGGAFIGLLFGVIVTFLYSLSTRKLLWVSQIEQMGLRVLGEISFGRGYEPGRADLLGAENVYKSIRALVELRGDSPKLLAFSFDDSVSPQPPLALGFCEFLASKGLRTLLLDCDFSQKPSATTPGLAEILEARDRLDEIAPSLLKSNLWVIERGVGSVEPGILFLKGEFRQILAHFTNQFEWVIVKLAPITLESYRLVSAEAVGSVVLGFQRDASTLDSLTKITNLCRQYGVDVLGVVFIS